MTSADNDDACPFVYASILNDLDGDGCVDDLDEDGVPDSQDLCPGHDDTIDNDGDGIIDGCDDYLNDSDNDGVNNSVDNCPEHPNTNQTNMDGDDKGDTCDDDIDGDTSSIRSLLMIQLPSPMTNAPIQTPTVRILIWMAVSMHLS